MAKPLPPLEPLGARPRAMLVRVHRPTFRVYFDADGVEARFDRHGDDIDVDWVPARRRQSKTFFSETAAYRWLARRYVFARRDRYAESPWTPENKDPACKLCKLEPPPRYLGHGEHAEPTFCRYHDWDNVDRLVTRLARWLRWRDRRRAEMAKEGG